MKETVATIIGSLGAFALIALGRALFNALGKKGEKADEASK